MAVKQTAGRNGLGDLAPKFAELNDDVLFGEVWSREDKLSLRDRSVITVVALVSKGITDSSLMYHITNAKNHGVTKTEMVEIITHIAFYVGWPNAWAVFPMVREVYAEEKTNASDSLFGLGEPNNGFAQYFIGNSYLKPLNVNGVGVFNVTFEPKCRNNWHITTKAVRFYFAPTARADIRNGDKKRESSFPEMLYTLRLRLSIGTERAKTNGLPISQ